MFSTHINLILGLSDTLTGVLSPLLPHTKCRATLPLVCMSHSQKFVDVLINT